MPSPKGRNNSTKQAGLNVNPGAYGHQHMSYPVLGIVLNVYPSDDKSNTSAIIRNDYRGVQHEATVLVLKDGGDSHWVLPKVVIRPMGASGADNYQEELPRPCTKMLDGTIYNSDLSGLNPDALDGDWVVVQFLGGSMSQPYMVGWWPHPYNHQDPATNNSTDKNYLKQVPRYFKRIQGTKVTVTNKGSVFVDTNESNSTLIPGPSISRAINDEGGDIQVDVKASRKLEINFNPSVPNPTVEPTLPQPNPPNPEQNRQDTATRVTLDDETISLIAAKVATILSRNDKILLQSPIEIDANAPKINLGDGALTPVNNGVVIGQGIDPFTGLTYAVLNNISLNVLAKK